MIYRVAREFGRLFVVNFTLLFLMLRLAVSKDKYSSYIWTQKSIDNPSIVHKSFELRSTN